MYNLTGLKGTRHDGVHIMYAHLAVVVLASIATSAPAVAQEPEPYAPPRTEYGHPDFQGVWSPEFITNLERAADVPNLVVSPEQAAAMVADFWTRWADNNQDPDVSNHNIESSPFLVETRYGS